VGCPLKVASDGCFETLVVVGDHQLHTRKSPPLQGPEELLVGGPKLSVSATPTPRTSLKPSSLTPETTKTPRFTTLWSTLTFS
jgi:hypothetical protein